MRAGWRLVIDDRHTIQGANSQPGTIVPMESLHTRQPPREKRVARGRIGRSPTPVPIAASSGPGRLGRD